MDTVNDIATIVGLIRDVILLLVLAVALFGVLFVVKKGLGLLNAAKQAVETTRDIMETVSDRVVKPASSNPGAFRLFGSLLGFLAGFFRRSRD